MTTDKPEPNPDERFIREFTRAQPALRAYLYALLPTILDVDDVMQEVSIVLWKKFSDYDPTTPFLRWAYVVARYQALVYRRQKARDRHVFGDALLASLAEDCEEQTDILARERVALQSCMEKLPQSKRRLLLAFYRGSSTATELAGQLSCERRTLYKRISRIREQLRICVRARVTS